jgi:hypothetical protein
MPSRIRSSTEGELVIGVVGGVEDTGCEHRVDRGKRWGRCPVGLTADLTAANAITDAAGRLGPMRKGDWPRAAQAGALLDGL